MATGTRVTLFSVYGDDYSEERYYDNCTLIPDCFNYTYEDTGIYDVTMRVSNSLAYEDHTGNVTVGFNVEGLEVIANTTVKGQDTVFTRRITNGTYMTCSTAYGDGYIRITYNDTPAFEEEYSHVYGNASVYNVTVRCYNLFSYMVRTLSVAVQEPVADFHVGSEIVYHAYEETLIVSFTMTAGTDVTITTTMDGSELLPPQQLLGDLTGEINYDSTHYTTVGVHAVQVLAENVVSREVRDIQLIVDKTITNLRATADKHYAVPGEIITVQATTDDGSNILYVIEYGAVSMLDDLWTTYAHGGSFSHDMGITYDDPGYYTLNVTAKNNVSSAWDTLQLGIEIPLPNATDLALVGENRTRPNTSHPVLFTITQLSGDPPTSTLASWNYGESEPALQEYFSLDAGMNYTHAHYYSEYGNYVVAVTLSNNVSNVMLSTVVTVGVYIENLTLDILQSDGDDKYAVGEQLTFRLHVSQGSELLYMIDYGNGYTSSHTPRTEIADWTASDTTDFITTFNEPGSFTVVATATNAQNSIHATTDVQVMEVLAGLSFHVREKVNGTSDQTIFPIGVTLEFVASISVGLEVNYTWQLSQDVTRWTREQTLEYEYNDVGEYLVRLTAQNPVSTEVVTKTITLSEPIGLKDITYNETVIIEEQALFHVELQDAVSLICYYFNFMHDTTGTTIALWRGTSSSFCATDEAFQSSRFSQIQAAKDLVVMQAFNEIENWTWTLTIFNDQTRASVQRTLEVLPIPCEVPIITVKNKGNSSDNPITHLKSEEMLLSTSVFHIIIDCQRTDVVESAWTIFDGDDTPIPFADVDAEMVLSSLQIPPPLKLEYGLYRFHYTAQMQGLPEFVSSSDIFYQIEGTPLIVNIMEGSDILVGNQQVLSLDGASLSVDPDDVNNPVGRFSWYCMRADEEPGFDFSIAPLIELPSTG